MSRRVDIAINQSDTSVFPATQRRLVLPPPTDAAISQGPRGLESVTLSLPTSPDQSYDLISKLGALTTDVTAAGVRLARGRVEDVQIGDDGAQLVALGAWNELSDRLYTGLWSASGTPGWFPASPSADPLLATNRTPEMYAIEISERIVISTTKGASYANGADVGGVAFRVPDNGARQIIGMQFALTQLLPTDWELRLNIYSPAATTPFTEPSAGLLVTSAYYLTFVGADMVELYILNNTGAASAPAGETGDWYAQISDIRLVTTTTTTVNTTTTGPTASGIGVTIPVASTANMYVGQQLRLIGLVFDDGEIITVSSITSPTALVADVRDFRAIGSTLRGFYVPPNEVVASLLAYSATSGGVLSSSTAFISASPRDLFNALWEDTAPADIIADLAARDGYETGVNGAGTLYWRPAGSAATAWFVDAADLTVQQSLSALVNRVIGRYQATDGRTLRAAAQTNAASVSRYGVTRAGVVDADTTLAVLAQSVAATAAADTADPLPSAALTVDAIYTASGALAPLWLLQVGDTITIRNLPVTATAAINRIQTLRVAGVVYDAVAGTVQITPETSIPSADYQAAAILRASEAAANLSSTPAAAAALIVAPQQVRRNAS
jgi:hypothetical protein